jgi:hypothetical protein
MAEAQQAGVVGRARAISVSLMNSTPQLGMWQATGTAIAQAPNLVELREPESGGSNITFDAHGHSARIAKPDEEDGGLVLITSPTGKLQVEQVSAQDETAPAPYKHGRRRHHAGAHMRSLHEKHRSDVKEKWGPTIEHGLKAFWVFFLTPSGFLITIYGLNVVVSLCLESCETVMADDAGLGCHALLPAPQCSTSHVPSILQ